VPRPAVAIALPSAEYDAVRHHLDEAGYEALAAASADDLASILRSGKDVGLAVLDVENDFDTALEMYALLHEAGRHIPALLLMPPRSFGRIGLGSSQVRDEYFQRPYSAESLRWRIEAMLIRGEAESEDAVLSPAPAPAEYTPRSIESLPAPGAEVASPGTRPGSDQPPAAGHVIIVFNPKGGVGKTTISINLGAVLQARKSQRVLLVDCDTITGHIASSLGMERLRTLAQAWNEQAAGGPTEGIAQIASVHSSGVSVLVLASSPLHTEVLEPIRVASAVADARRSYDWIILDMHPDYGPLNQNLFALAERILVPVTPDVPCIRAAVQFREVADELGLRDRMALIINRARSGVASGDVERVVGIQALARVRSAGMLFVKAADQGRSAVEVSPASRVVGDLEILGGRLMGSIAGTASSGDGARRWIPVSVRNLLDRITSKA
jgi:MinD-like ATPase involved in chromosome partitioning or flagellar assembly